MKRRTLTVLVLIHFVALSACKKEEQPEPPTQPQAAAESAPESAAAVPEAAPEESSTEGTSLIPDVNIPDASEQVAQVSDSLKAAMNDYIANLGEANDILGDVRSAMSAAAASPKLAPVVDKLKDFKTQWDSLDPDMKNQLATLFKDQVQPLVDQVNQQIERISNDPTLGEPLQSLLSDIPLIEL